jgi:CRP/FNR family transcriptional regulator
MSDKAKLWYLEHFDVLQKLSKDDLVNMEKAMVMKSLTKNTLLSFPEMRGSYIYFLKTGVVKIASMDDEGREFIKYLVKPGYLFGELALLESSEHPDDYAIAAEDCIVCFMEAEKMKQMMMALPEFNIRVRKMIGFRIKKVENRMRDMIFKDAKTRIKDFLDDFVKDFGKEENGSYKVKNFLTHDDIAKLTSTSRQTVTSVLNTLREQKLIAYNDKELQVLSSKAIA